MPTLQQRLYEGIDPYLGNPTAKRDLRVQLRGNRAVILFTVYLVVFTGFLMLFYSNNIESNGSTVNLARAQSQLQGFYYFTLAMLGIAITLIATAMGAFSIVVEKQRRSLDLVFSAPTTPRQYLIGKLLSSYRYVWLLLMLSLPFCAVSVSLGGVTWGELFITAILFSVYGLVCVAFGMLFSTMLTKSLPTLVWSYLSIIGFISFSSFITVSLGPRTGSSFANPFAPTPFAFFQIAREAYPIFGVQIPAFLITVFVQFILIGFLSLVSAVQLAPSDQAAIRKLRIAGLVLTSILGIALSNVLGNAVSSTTAAFGASIVSVQSTPMYFSRAFSPLIIVLGLAIVPPLSGFTHLQLRRHRPDQLWKPKELLNGTTGGNAPFLALTFLVAFVSTIFGSRIYFSNASLSQSFANIVGWHLAYFALAGSLWFFAFAIGIFVSGRTLDLQRAKTTSLLALIFLLAGPVTLAALTTPEEIKSGGGLWPICPIAAYFCDKEFVVGFCIGHTVFFMIIGYVLLSISKSKLKPQWEKKS